MAVVDLGFGEDYKHATKNGYVFIFPTMRKKIYLIVDPSPPTIRTIK
jgi:hypothetical protein